MDIVDNLVNNLLEEPITPMAQKPLEIKNTEDLQDFEDILIMKDTMS